MQRRIEILSFPNVQLLDLAGPLQVFASANDLEKLKGRNPAYLPVVVGAKRDTLTSSGLAVAAEPFPSENLPLDTLVVPGGWGVNAVCEKPALVKWVKERSQTARRTVSVCSGAFLLATAGLLDGRRAVTHWQRCEEFALRFPRVKLDPDPIFIRDGSFWTSAGVTAGIDLALALVEADLGREIALAVARQLVVFLKRPGGQSQFSAALTLQDNGGRFDKLHAWLGQNLHRPLKLADLADQAGMSPRSFSRHYRAETGRTPARALEDLRLEQARRLLEQGTYVSRTADRCGFGTEETMRQIFLRRLGVSPQAYRERFSA
ncbi:GlxA family transcriptional regulator [Roseibium litorale]|uniref:GlxA family transcriptional regulator n=1 Tax=Roseibium litorale TaxID=2803841 RepID=A0ABR9CNA0_9HYPH|nr:GlxA family transcriptional regulator [Roseibium litorale]MBD8892168.1 GlxA family transcriptional regulator [Roseibium litorale]